MNINFRNCFKTISGISVFFIMILIFIVSCEIPEDSNNETAAEYILSIVNDGNGTTVPSGDVTVNHGVPTNISATANTGYVFLNWTEVTGDTDITDDNSTSTTAILISGNTTIRANFVTAGIPKLYVANRGDFTVSVIDGLGGTLDATIDVSSNAVPFDKYPAAVGVNPNTEKVYIVHDDGNLTVIDATTNTITETILINGNGYPSIAVNPFTNTIFVASEYDDVHVIDGSSDVSTDTFGYAGDYLNGIAVNSLTNKVYITDWSDYAVHVYNGNTYDYITDASIDYSGDWYGWPAANNVTNKIYVPDDYADILFVIDGSTDAEITNIALGNAPTQAAVNTITNMIYVTNNDDDTVSVVNGTTNTVDATIDVGVQPFGIAVSENYNKIYAVNSGDDTISIIDGATNTVTHTVIVGNNPQTVGVLE